MGFAMPVRFLTSSVHKWPDREQVAAAAVTWARSEAARRPELVRLGYFGSYARGDAGVGSDLDLVAVVRTSDQPFERRPISWDLTSLPVPAELLVYTEAEWKGLVNQGGRFARVLREESVWLVGSAPAPT